VHVLVWHVRCQSDACAVYDISERSPGTYCVKSLRYCLFCVAVLYPDTVRTRISREQFVSVEIMRIVPELVGKAYIWKCDEVVPGGCSLKRPDLLFIMEFLYIQIEVDEHNHEGYRCWDEDARLEIIAADVGLPGVVLRVNPDAAPMLKRRKLKCGEMSWAATDSFAPIMDEVRVFLEWVLKRVTVSDVEKYSISQIGDLLAYTKSR